MCVWCAQTTLQGTIHYAMNSLWHSPHSINLCVADIRTYHMSAGIAHPLTFGGTPQKYFLVTDLHPHLVVVCWAELSQHARRHVDYWEKFHLVELNVLIKFHQNNRKVIYFWRFDLCQRPSSEEAGTRSSSGYKNTDLKWSRKRIELSPEVIVQVHRLNLIDRH